MDELKAYMDDYAKLIYETGAYEKDYEKWVNEQNTQRKSDRKEADSFYDYRQDLNGWLDARSKYINDNVIGDFSY